MQMAMPGNVKDYNTGQCVNMGPCVQKGMGVKKGTGVETGPCVKKDTGMKKGTGVKTEQCGNWGPCCLNHITYSKPITTNLKKIKNTLLDTT